MKCLYIKLHIEDYAHHDLKCHKKSVRKAQKISENLPFGDIYKATILRVE